MTLRAILTTSALLFGAIATSIAAEPAPIKGFATEKPQSGPSVKVDGGYMVPYTQTIPGTDISFEMIPVPGGTYKMGSPENEAGRGDDEGPQIEVVVDPMWVCKTEVRWIEYKEFMGMYKVFKEFASQHVRQVTDDNKVDAVTTPTELYEPSYTFEFGEEDNQPAVTMTQFAAKQYTKWLSKLIGVQYRVPTEAEWEWAARAGTDSAYYWGDSPAEFDQYGWCEANSPDGPSIVGQKKPNAFGLYDVLGNVAEWTVDAHPDGGYKQFAGKKINAVDAIKSVEEGGLRVARGGSWEMEPAQCRCASRLFSEDEDWKLEDPNFPLSPWWFTNDPSRGVGMRVFRSWKTLADEKIAKFWELDSEDIEFDVISRLKGGKGVIGLVDQKLPELIKQQKE